MKLLPPLAVAVTAAALLLSTQAHANKELAQKNACLACHAVDKKLVGPAYIDVSKKYPGQADHLLQKIKAGSTGVWGAIPMPPQTLGDDEAKAIARWLAESPAP